MSDEFKACPGCGKAGMKTYQRLANFTALSDPYLFGCVHCGIYTTTQAAWNTLPREAEPIPQPKEAPK